MTPGWCIRHPDVVSQLIGRGEELGRLLAVLAAEGPRRVHLGAVAGMGKTSVWRAFVEAASAAPGVEVLTARPLESEAGLGLSGLADLLSTLPEQQYDDLPEPQRMAVRSALLLESGDSADPRALAAGVRGILQRRARDGCAVLAIDDAHWLDASSSAVLSQALARLEEADVRVVVAARPEGRPVDSWLPGADTVVLPAMDTAALFHVVREHTGEVLDRGQLRSLALATGGNPLHALEVVRSRSGGSIGSLVADRIRSLPRETRRVLLTAALSASPVVDVVSTACGLSGEELLTVLEPAVGAQLAAVQGDRVVFAHPLHLDAAIDVAADLEVTAAHVALAGAEPRPEVAVRHRALVVEGHDAALATSLAEAAATLHARGAWDESCEVLELAVDRTPDDLTRDERMHRLGDWLHRAGRPGRAAHWLGAAAGSSDPLVAATATMHLCQALIYMGHRDETHDMIRGLLAADLPPMLACEVSYRLGRDLKADQLDESLEMMREINAELDRLPPQPGLMALRAETLAEEARLRTFTGHSAGDLLARALELERQEPPDFLLRSAALAHAQSAAQAGHFARARAEFDALLQQCADRGDDFSLPIVTFLSASLDFRAGRWEQARQAAAEAGGVAVGQGQLYGPLLRLVEEVVAGLRGDTASALEWLLDPSPSTAGETDLPFHGNRLTAAVHLLLMLERPEEAWAAARQARELVHSIGWRDPCGHVIDQEYIEAAILTGRTTLAREALDELRAIALRMGNRQITLVVCQRLEAQLLAAEGDVTAAAAAVPAMVAAHRDGPAEPIQVGKALLTAGELLRRARQRRLAAEHLTEAIAVFERLGAAPYAARARAALERLGARAEARPTGLTPNEERVARLAAAGERNREIAAELFVSVKTVEAVLSAVYRKLGVRSRVELAPALEGRTAGKGFAHRAGRA